MRTRSTTRRSSTSQRRKLVWARSQTTGNQAIAQGAILTSNLLSQFEVAYGAGLIGCTIMRVRGTFAVQNTTANFSCCNQLGLQVGPDDLTSAQLDPVVRFSDDWMYWDAQLTNNNATGEFSLVNNYKIDVRAKRRLDELGDTLWFTTKNFNPAASGQVAQWAFSILIAMP